MQNAYFKGQSAEPLLNFFAFCAFLWLRRAGGVAWGRFDEALDHLRDLRERLGLT